MRIFLNYTGYLIIILDAELHHVVLKNPQGLLEEGVCDAEANKERIAD